MTELRGLKFVTTLVLELEKIENSDKGIYSTFYSNSKTETIINESTLMMHLNKYIVLLYQTYESLRKRFRLDY